MFSCSHTDQHKNAFFPVVTQQNVSPTNAATMASLNAQSLYAQPIVPVISEPEEIKSMMNVYNDGTIIIATNMSVA